MAASSTLDIIDQTDWSRLHHAYGRAVDTPTHLRALLGADGEARNAAMSHLWSAVIHQGTPWSVTAPAAAVVARIVGDARLDGVPELRAALLSFLAEVGSVLLNSGIREDEVERMAAGASDAPADPAEEEAFFEDIDVADAYYARSLLACVRIAPTLLDAVRPQLQSSDEKVRSAASYAAARLATATLGSGANAELEATMLAKATAAADPDERCAVVLALGEIGAAPRTFLADPSAAVRVCAALAPALASDERAIDVLVGALEDAEHLDGWFRSKPPQMAMWPRFSVVAALLDRVGDFDRIVVGAIALARITNVACVDFDWGKLLAAAFAAGDGMVRTDAQRRFLEALVDNAALWEKAAGNPRLWFAKAGLPYDRAACAERVARERERSL